jgi:hypothetical protein
MAKLTQWLNGDPSGWLLSEGAPYVRYRTLVDLLDRPESDAEVQSARKAMLADAQVKSLIAALKDWPGEPLTHHNDAKHVLHKLATLADFGVRADDPGMSTVVKKVLAHQSPEGAFQVVMAIPQAFGGSGKKEWTWMLCDAPTTLYALLTFGLGDRPSVARAIECLTSLIRDNGWPCGGSPAVGKFRGPGRKEDPCPIANLIAMKALAQVPSLRGSKVARTGAEMLLSHWEQQREKKFYLFGIGTDFKKLKYPFVWYDILHYANVLSRFPFAVKDRRFREVIDTLVAKQDDQGHFAAESTWMAWKGWDFADKKNPSPWLTFLVCRILKRSASVSSAK